MYRIGKSFTFQAGHWLDGLPDGHKCGRQHGHSYAVDLVLAASDLVEPGFVVDFAALSPLAIHLAEVFDHRNLNDVVTVQPTSENLARVIFDWCADRMALPDRVTVEAVRVSETPSTWAEYRPIAASDTR